jgi:hypothetical protein
MLLACRSFLSPQRAKPLIASPPMKAKPPIKIEYKKARY